MFSLGSLMIFAYVQLDIYNSRSLTWSSHAASTLGFQFYLVLEYDWLKPMILIVLITD